MTRLYEKEPIFNVLIAFILLYLRHLTTKPTKWHVRPAKAQIILGIRPVWQGSSLSTWGKLMSLAIIRAHSEASDQTGRMPRLIWVFAGRNVILLVLSWEGSFYFVSFASTILISVISRRFISWNSPRKREYFYTDRSKAVLLLWFLTVLAVCVYTLVHLLF